MSIDGDGVDDVKPAVAAVLFDVGGVLVQVAGVERLRRWKGFHLSDDAIWRLWLGSDAVRAFESGRINEQVFAARLIAELELPMGPKDLIREFVEWVPAPFPGAHELLDDIAPGIQRGTLSNSNALHWPHIMEGMGLGTCFDTHFVSHLTGWVKPDSEAFEHAVAELGCPPDSIVFMDDNQINVDAAQRSGIRAYRTRGTREARSLLARLGLLVETGTH